MQREWQRVRWESRVIDLADQAGIGVELWAAPIAGGPLTLRGRVLYWDAEGQLFFEMNGGEVPIVVLEELIAEAKALTHLDRPRRRKAGDCP